MTGPDIPDTPKHSPARAALMLGLPALVLGLAALAACGLNRGSGPGPADDKKDPTVPSVGSIPLFGQWPKDRKPDAALILSGETFGFLQPCGCSRPQMGGLERRAVFIDALKAKGWPVAGLDLGDVYPPKPKLEDQALPKSRAALEEQALLKYKTALAALREMGYVAVGLGKAEFAVGVDKILAEYALQKEQPPFTLAGNLIGVAGGKPMTREERFPPPEGAKRPLVGLVEIAEVGGVPVGIAGVVGKSLWAEAKKADPSIDFHPDTAAVLKQAVAGLAADPRKPKVNVLLYQGTPEEAKAEAAAFPQFQIVLCLADDPEPPQFPEMVGGPNHPAGQKTMVIQVGQKGRYVGVVGLFKTAAGGFDLKYQLVPLGEEYITPGAEAEAFKANKVLPILEIYAEQVRDRGFLKVPQTPHPYQIQEPKLNLSFVGSERCQNCHAAEYTKWEETPHSHALDALEKIAKRPGLRNFDAECVVCHTVGLGYKTGYEDEKKTPHLKHVGCENCHGPGSGHATNPRDKSLLSFQSPWKQKPEDRLPDAAFMKKMADLSPLDRGKVAIDPGQLRVIRSVEAMCAKCHDHENDPHFDLYKYWPKVNHTFGKK